MGDGAQIFRVHDVSAVSSSNAVIYSPGRWASSIINICRLARRYPASAQHFAPESAVLVYDVANVIFFPFLDVVLPRQALVQVPWFGSRLLI